MLDQSKQPSWLDFPDHIAALPAGTPKVVCALLPNVFWVEASVKSTTVGNPSKKTALASVMIDGSLLVIEICY